MTDTLIETPAEPLQAPTPDWNTEFARLRQRFRGVKDTILFCVHALQQNQHLALDDLKAQATLHGLRITAASLNAAHRLLTPQPPPPAIAAATAGAAPRSRRGRHAPMPRSEPPGDMERMIVEILERVRAESAARIAQLEAALREAMTVIRDALG